MWDFEIDSDTLKHEMKVPYFEDARAEDAPNYSSKRTLDAAKSELSQWVSKHGGIVTAFLPVKFNQDKLRYGFVVEFMFQGGARGRIHVAALPMRKEDPQKKERVLVQAVLNTADRFKADYLARLHDPYSNPLLQYLLVDGEHTVAQMIVEKQQLALLGSGIQSPNDVRS